MLDDLQPSSPEFDALLTRQLHELRSTRSSDEVISELWKLLSRVDEEFPYLAVIGELCVEHARAQKNEEVADLYALAVSRFPSSLNAHIAYAERLVWSEGDAATALEVSTKAVDLARKERVLVRHALQGKARAAKKLKLYSLFEEILEEILLTEQLEIRGDIQYEIDVVEDVPEGLVDSRLINEFQHRCRDRWHDA